MILTLWYIYHKIKEVLDEQIQTAKARRKDFLERMEQNENV